MVENIIKRLRLNNSWGKLSLGKYNDFYIIAIKEGANKRDDFKASDVKRIRFEFGIDCGIKDAPLTIQNVTLNFDDATSSNNHVNKITAYARLLNLPSDLYIKVVSVDLADGRTVSTGETSISININAVNLD